MKTTFLYSLLLVATLMFVGGVAVAEDAAEIMKKSHMAYYYAGDDGVADVTMDIVKSNGKTRTREFTMLRLDLVEGGEQKYYTYFRKPSDVSRMTFMVWKNPNSSDDRWLYIPAVDLVKRISADDKNSSFVGSNFSYEDVSGRHWTEDTHTLVSADETLDSRPVYLISSKPNDPGYKAFAEKKTWVDKENYLPLKEEYYNDKGELIRVFAADQVEEIDGILTVVTRTMKDIKGEQHTTITFNNIDYNTGVGDDIFTERYLKAPPRQYIK